jgi:hypothetical protein
MPQVQINLLNQKTEGDSKRTRIVKGVKTKKQLYKDGQDARSSLTDQLQAIGKEIGRGQKPEDFQAVIDKLHALKKTDSYKTLVLCNTRNAFWWLPDCNYWLAFLIQRAEMGRDSKQFIFVKYKEMFDNSNPRKLYYTCCGHRVSGRAWVVESSCGAIFCKKCFTEKYSNKRFLNLPQKQLAEVIS